MTLIVGSASFVLAPRAKRRGLWRDSLGSYPVVSLSVGACQACRTVAMSYAFIFTFAARVQLLYSLHPLWAGIVCWLVLKEALPMRTIVALFSALVALGVTFWPEISMGRYETRPDEAASLTVEGDALALLTSFSVAAFLCLSRYSARAAPDLSVPFASAVGLGLAAIGVFVGGTILSGSCMPFFHVEVETIFACFLDGLSVGAINLAFSIAPKYITATQVGLTSLVSLFSVALFFWADFTSFCENCSCSTA